MINKKIERWGTEREMRCKNSFQVCVKTNKEESIPDNFPSGQAMGASFDKIRFYFSEHPPLSALWTLANASGFSSFNTFISVHILYLQTCEEEAYFLLASYKYLQRSFLHTHINRRTSEFRFCLLNCYYNACKEHQRQAYDVMIKPM